MYIMLFVKKKNNKMLLMIISKQQILFFYLRLWFIAVKADKLRTYEGRHIHDRAWGHLIQGPYMLAFPVYPGQSLCQLICVENVKSTVKQNSLYEFRHIDNFGVFLCRLDRWIVFPLLCFKLTCKSSHPWGHADTPYSAIPEP